MKGEPVYAVPKPLPRALRKRAQQAQAAALDKQETAKARQRACGRCEVRGFTAADNGVRCSRRDAHTHHLKGGIGRRNKGDSILATWKLRVCARCHQDITGHVLVPLDRKADATQVVYRRTR